MAQFWQRAPVHERASCALNGASQKKCSASAAAKQIAFDPKSFPISSRDKQTQQQQLTAAATAITHTRPMQKGTSERIKSHKSRASAHVQANIITRAKNNGARV